MLIKPTNLSQKPVVVFIENSGGSWNIIWKIPVIFICS